jgi:membrane fusion protein (multidrug efflux system)
MVINGDLLESATPVGVFMRKGITAIAVVLGTALALSGCNEKAQQQVGAPPTPEVGFVTVHAQRVDITNELPGRTVPSLIAEVRPQVSGIIQKRAFTEGSEVKAGDLLYQIDPAPYQAAYDSSVAALARANAGLISAQAKAKRYDELSNRSVVSQQDLETAVAASEQAKADVASAQASLEAAKINLGNTKLTAPINGRIGVSSLTQGALVTANQTNALATIQSLDPIYVDVTQSSTEILKLRRQIESGQLQRQTGAIKAKLILEDGTTYKEEGELHFTDVTVGQSTGTVTLRATFANPDRILLPGMFVRAIVEVGSNPNAILVPQRGVSRDPRGQATALFVTSDNKVEQRSIIVSQTRGADWIVEKGISDGDRLIVDGLQKIRAGVAVKPVEVQAHLAQSQPGDGAAAKKN